MDPLFEEFPFAKFCGFLQTLLKNVKPKKKKIVSWKNSQAKAQLELDILAEVVDEESNPEDVYDHWPELYHDYDFNNFKTNLKSLLEKIAGQRSRAYFDTDAYENDRELNPFPMFDGHGRLQWDGSEAQRLVRKDIDDGLFDDDNNKPKPRDYWMSNEEFRMYELEQFRKHIYKEIKGLKSRVFFEDKKRRWNYGG